MRVRVQFFAAARDLVGQEYAEVTLDDEATIVQLRQELKRRFPPLAPSVRHLVFALGTDYAADATRLSEGQEIACIPPVSGG